MKKLGVFLSFCFFIAVCTVFSSYLIPTSTKIDVNASTEIALAKDVCEVENVVDINQQPLNAQTGFSYKSRQIGDKTLNILLNYINYPNDNTNHFTQEEITSSMTAFNRDVKEYFNVMSQGNLTINMGYVVYTAPKSYNYYKTHSLTYPTEVELFRSAYQNWPNTIVDMDGNQMGCCNLRVNVFAGKSGEWGSALWPHSYMSDALILLTEQDQNGNNYLKPSILSHETGHAMGLDDLYDYENNSRALAVGSWDMMASGHQFTEINAYHRWQLGWLQPSDYFDDNNTPVEELNSSATLDLYPCLTQDPTKTIAVKFGDNGTECFVAELRVKDNSAFIDSTINKTSVVIYRVNKTVSGNKYCYTGYKNNGPETCEIVFMGDQSYAPHETDYINSCGLTQGQTYGSKTNGTKNLVYSSGNSVSTLFSGDNSNISLKVNSLTTEKANITIMYLDEIECTIDASTDGYGTITPSHQIVEVGNTATFTITPNANFKILDFFFDGVSVGESVLASIINTNTYSFCVEIKDIGAHTIFVIFASLTTEITCEITNDSSVQEIYLTETFGATSGSLNGSSFNFGSTVYLYVTLNDTYHYFLEEDNINRKQPAFENTYLLKTIQVYGDVSLEFEFTVQTEQFAVSCEKGEYISEVYLSPSSDGSLLMPSGTKFDYGSTVYYFVRVFEDTAEYAYFISEGNYTSKDETLYYIGSLPVSASSNIFPTINAERKKQVYTITWLNDDSTQLDEKEYEYGTTPTYSGTPTKEATQQYSYKFKGWSPEVTIVTQSITYTATYTKILQKYTITFYDEDKTTEIGKSTVDYGTDATFPETPPTKQSTDEYDYILSWVDENGDDDDLSNVIANRNVYAKFTESIRQYEVSISNCENTEKCFISSSEDATDGESSGKFDYGLTVYLFIVLKEDTAKYTYTAPDYATLINERLYSVGSIIVGTSNQITGKNAIQTINKYTISWYNGETMIYSEQLEYDALPEYDVLTYKKPSKQETAQYSYEFDGWLPEIETVTKDQDYVATYIEVPQEYTIFFYKDKNSEHIASSTVYYGETAVFEGVTPTKSSTEGCDYEFCGWVDSDGNVDDLSNVIENRYVYANFKEFPKQFKITFVSNNPMYGTVSETELSVEYNTQIQIDDNKLTIGTNEVYAIISQPTQNHTFKFVEWQGTVNFVKTDITITAVFDFSVNKYTVTLNNQETFFTSFLSLYANAANPIDSGNEFDYNTKVYYFIKLPQNTAEFSYSVINGTLISETTFRMGYVNVTQNQTINLSAIKTKNKYTITWKKDNNTTISSVEHFYGETAVKINDPIKQPHNNLKYIFVGWKNSLGEFVDEFLVVKNETYTAYFNEYNQISLISNVNNVEATNDICKLYEKDIMQLENPLNIKFANGTIMCLDKPSVNTLKENQDLFITMKNVDKYTLTSHEYDLVENFQVVEFKIKLANTEQYINYLGGTVKILFSQPENKDIKIYALETNSLVSLNLVTNIYDKVGIEVHNLSPYFAIEQTEAQKTEESSNMVLIISVGAGVLGVTVLTSTITIIKKRKNKYF